MVHPPTLVYMNDSEIRPRTIMQILALIVSCMLLGVLSGCNNRDTDSVRILRETLTRRMVPAQAATFVSYRGQKVYTAGEAIDAHAAYTRARRCFSTQLLLQKMIDDSLLNGARPLRELIPTLHTKLTLQDLVSVPANHDLPILLNPDSASRLITQVIQTAHGNPGYLSLKDFMETRFPADDGLLERFAQLSDVFDAQYPVYAPPGQQIADLFPTWYTHNTVQFFGWRVFTFLNHTVLWQYFDQGDTGIFLLKFMDKGVFAAVQGPAVLPSDPLRIASGDLLRSSLVLGLAKAILIPFSYTVVDYRKPLSADTKASLARWSDSPYGFLFLEELAVHAWSNPSEYDTRIALRALYQRYTGDTLLAHYRTGWPRAAIQYVGNGADAGVPFALQRDTLVQIFAAGQSKVLSRFAGEAYQYDNVQIFMFDAARRQPPAEAMRTYHFNLGFFDKVIREQYSGEPQRWIDEGVVQYAHGYPGDTVYILETKLAWEDVLGRKPFVGLSTNLNILVGDSDLDERRRKSILSWAVAPGSGWNDVSRFGWLTLVQKPMGKSMPGQVTAVYTMRPPRIDGLVDPSWETMPYTRVAHVYDGVVSDHADNAAMFKVQWDRQYLYFLFYVVDNCRNQPGIVTIDKCWIENAATGAVCWKMNADTAGMTPSFSVRQRVWLKRGTYRLRYTSDRRHSYAGWYGKPPANRLYGAEVYPVQHE